MAAYRVFRIYYNYGFDIHCVVAVVSPIWTAFVVEPWRDWGGGCGGGGGGGGRPAGMQELLLRVLDSVAQRKSSSSHVLRPFSVRLPLLSRRYDPSPNALYINLLPRSAPSCFQLISRRIVHNNFTLLFILIVIVKWHDVLLLVSVVIAGPDQSSFHWETQRLPVVCRSFGALDMLRQVFILSYYCR